MLSDMESSPSQATRAEALADLERVERARADFAAGLVLPLGYDIVLGTAVAAQITSAAVGLTTSAAWAGLLVLGGLVVFGLAAGAQLLRFRQRNGAWLGGFVHQATFGVSWPAALGYAVALAAAMVAANARNWLLVGLAALCGGIVWSVASVHWMRRYRAAGVAASGSIDARLTGAASIGLVILTVALLVLGRV
jgi:hypothetical protein